MDNQHQSEDKKGIDQATIALMLLGAAQVAALIRKYRRQKYWAVLCGSLISQMLFMILMIATEFGMTAFGGVLTLTLLPPVTTMLLYIALDNLKDWILISKVNKQLKKEEFNANDPDSR